MRLPTINTRFTEEKNNQEKGKDKGEKKKLEDCTVEELRERDYMEGISDVSEGEVEKSMNNLRTSTRMGKGTRSTGDLANNDFVLEKKQELAKRKGKGFVCFSVT